jgi:predicted nucleic acid-binding Zn ribbon protein
MRRQGGNPRGWGPRVRVTRQVRAGIWEKKTRRTSGSSSSTHKSANGALRKALPGSATAFKGSGPVFEKARWRTSEKNLESARCEMAAGASVMPVFLGASRGRRGHHRGHYRSSKTSRDVMIQNKPRLPSRLPSAMPCRLKYQGSTYLSSCPRREPRRVGAKRGARRRRRAFWRRRARRAPSRRGTRRSG